MSKDADALQAIMVRRIKEVAERMKKLAAGPTSPKRSSGPSNASKKVSKKATSTSAAALDHQRTPSVMNVMVSGVWQFHGMEQTTMATKFHT